MAEALMRVVDRDAADPGVCNAGDVMAVKPDGFDWGADERAAPWLMIVKVPSATVAQLVDMLECGDIATRPVKKRVRKIDRALMPAGARTVLDAMAAGSVKAGSTYTPRATESISVTRNQWNGAKAVR